MEDDDHDDDDVGVDDKREGEIRGKREKRKRQADRLADLQTDRYVFVNAHR